MGKGNLIVSFFNKGLKPFKKIFDSEISKFRFITALKLISIPILLLAFALVLLWFFLNSNLIFFEANGYLKIAELRVAYFDRILSALLNYAYLYIAFVLVIAFSGGYVANLFLRPFRLIGDYCDETLDGKKSSYDPEFFTDLKLLSSFSEYFFNICESAIENGELRPQQIPTRYTKIHRPVFERGFFLQFISLIIIMTICGGVGVFVAAQEVLEVIVQLSIETLPQGTVVKYFFQKQGDILEQIMMFVMVGYAMAYLFLAINLYGKVSSPAFGIFATMRSFLRGRYNSRVHLIGFYYVRDDCRKLNKYLDHMQKLSQDKKVDNAE